MHNILTQIQNAMMVGKPEAKVPYSKLNLAVAEALVKAGYLKSIQKKGRGLRRVIVMEFRSDKRVINEIKLISKPSRRIYRGYLGIRRSKQGYGNYFISTPKGIVTDVEARRSKIGGEVLFEIW